MKIIEIAEAREALGQYVGHGENLPLVVTDHGHPVAALLAVPNVDLETVSLSTNLVFVDLIERSRERQNREGGVSSQGMRRRFKNAPNQGIKRDKQ